MPSTVSTACQAFQATLRHVWASGSTYSEMTIFLGVTKDQLFRLRDKLTLPKRMDRAQRQKPPRHRDPTPTEIRAACAALRAKHLEARRAEPETRVYRKNEAEFVQFKLERAREHLDDELERLIDDFGDP